MSKIWKTRLLKYGITFAIGGLLVWAMLSTRGYAWSAGDAERYRLLCDAFTVPGLLFAMAGLLTAIGNTGSFTGLSYVLRYLGLSLVPGGRKKQESYYDYAQRKKGKEIHGYGFLMISGCVFLAVAIVFLILFYQVYVPAAV